jgi:hypothetical protein
MGDSDNENNNEFFDPEEEVGIGGDKKINLENVIIETGEEKEECIFKMRAKIFRWRNGEWKERGTGESKLLRHKDSKRVRYVLRQDKTLKPAANFVVSEVEPLCKLEAHQGSDKMFIFRAYDCSDEEPAFEKFVIKLGNAENGAKFKVAFEAAREFNRLIKEGKESEAVFADVIKEDDDDKKEKEDKKTEEKKEKTEEK